MNFRTWYEQKDIFGFSKENENIPVQNDTDELPIQGFDIGRLADRLGKNTLNGKKSYQRFINEMQWGDETGAIRVVVTPKLNLKIQRMHHDLEGNPIWIMKKYFFINDKNFGGKEDIVADEIFEQVKAVYKNSLDSSPGKTFDVSELAFSLAASVRRQDYNVIEYQGVKKINENEYDVFFWLKGGGVGKLTGPRGQRPALALVVKTSYNENTGVIKVIGQFITSVDDTTAWSIQPAEFEELYLPTQSKHEIIESILTSLKWF